MKYNSQTIDLRSLPYIEGLLFMGDSHDFSNQLRGKLSRITNSIVIICGDDGLGFQSVRKHEDDFQQLQHLCNKNNLYVLTIRGNHCDPRYYKYEYISKISEEITNYNDRVILVGDYDLIKTNFGNILAIGGGISIDRRQRSIGKTYWPDEQVKSFDIESFWRLKKETINIVVSHNAPIRFYPIGCKSAIADQFAEYDKTLLDELSQERELLQSIYRLIITHWKPTEWFYGQWPTIVVTL